MTRELVNQALTVSRPYPKTESSAANAAVYSFHFKLVNSFGSPSGISNAVECSGVAVGHDVERGFMFSFLISRRERKEEQQRHACVFMFPHSQQRYNHMHV